MVSFRIQAVAACAVVGAHVSCFFDIVTHFCYSCILRSHCIPRAVALFRRAEGWRCFVSYLLRFPFPNNIGGTVHLCDFTLSRYSRLMQLDPETSSLTHLDVIKCGSRTSIVARCKYSSVNACKLRHSGNLVSVAACCLRATVRAASIDS